MATSLAQAVDHLPRVDYTRPHYEQRPYVLVVCQTDERASIAAVGFRQRLDADDEGRRVLLAEARFLSTALDQNERANALYRLRKAAAGRPIDNEHHNGYGSSDLYVDGNRFVLEPAIEELTLYRPSYVVGIDPVQAEHLRPLDKRKPKAAPVVVPEPGWQPCTDAEQATVALCVVHCRAVRIEKDFASARLERAQHVYHDTVVASVAFLRAVGMKNQEIRAKLGLSMNDSVQYVGDDE